MSTDAPHQQFLLKTLPTKTVTLYPSRAHVVREIDNVVLRPGPNTIEIYGFTPTTDENSIQVDGRGAASIMDMTVDLVPNRDIFEDVYPEHAQLAKIADDEDDSLGDDDTEPSSMKSLTREISSIEAQIRKATDTQGSSISSLRSLDQYLGSSRSEHTDAGQFANMLTMYERQRQELFVRHSGATDNLESLNKQLVRKIAEKWRAGKDYRKQKAEQAEEKAIATAKKRRQEQEDAKEARRVRQEHLKYWPKKVWRIVLTLEASSIDTPVSSRRGSIDSVTISKGYTPPEKSPSADETIISLSVSYVTQEAFWNPRYDLSISSVNKSATITYRAEFGNRTSETWTDAKIVLSTSQTSYSGLDDKVPYMQPWHVKLGRYGDQGNAGLMSISEANKPPIMAKQAYKHTNRQEMFGLDQRQSYENAPGAGLSNNSGQKGSRVISQPNNNGFAGFANGSSLFGSNINNNTRGGFQPTNDTNTRAPLGYSLDEYTSVGPPQASQALSDYQTQLMLLEQQNKNRLLMARAQPLQQQMQEQQQQQQMQMPMSHAPQAPRGMFASVLERGERLDALTAHAPPPPPFEQEEDALEFEESTWEDTGMTTTYEVPGFRTLMPSSVTRRHKIASLAASNIALNYISIPKLRTAAFLKAQIRNPSSSITLLKGSAGVTLDNSFLGNMPLPRVSPGQAFDLPLGVDPAVHVSYPKPTVHRSTVGVFSKESNQVFSRLIYLTNTKSTPVEILVLDQIPVSEDERLNINVVKPNGLFKEGDRVRAGSSVRDENGKDTSWGKATAMLQKDGKVAWTVGMEKKGACLLRLEYEARLPSQEKIVQSVQSGST